MRREGGYDSCAREENERKLKRRWMDRIEHDVGDHQAKKNTIYSSMDATNPTHQHHIKMGKDADAGLKCKFVLLDKIVRENRVCNGSDTARPDVGVRNSGVKFESGGITIISIIIDVLHTSASPTGVPYNLTTVPHFGYTPYRVKLASARGKNRRRWER